MKDHNWKGKRSHQAMKYEWKKTELIKLNEGKRSRRKKEKKEKRD